MFRCMTGFKAQYQDLTLLAVSEFNEWKVLMYGPGVICHGTHQFSETKAKQHAIDLARHYVQERRHESLPEVADPEWSPTSYDDWLVWTG